MINGVAVTVPDCTTIYYLPCNGIQNADGHAGTTNCDGSTTILDFSNCGTGYDDDASSYGGGGIGAPNPTDNSSTSGGGTGSTTNTSNNNELIEGAIGIIRYDTTAASALKNNLLLSSAQIAWIGDSKNNTEVTLIYNFLEANKIGEDYTSEAKNFAELAVNAYINKGTVDYVDRIILDQTFVNSVAKAGLNKTSYFKSLDSTTQTNVLNMHSYLKANGKKITNAKTCQ
ncbi:hypothetical protein Lupro_09135 [Lutibacter profundi]|uniref:Uncharacterized protein n=1 Tax=Lutibacter profundi TaxID=1622118 RepID=A0A0X8G7D2_9FLAO|nr:hypothetical protein [Lutibacter profundi]AMC11415.1 hypothetical protein Lupro_09135 [Lutibacter profundi]